MPRIDPEPEEDLIAEREQFAAAFKRSKRGNLWRVYEGQTLTVFKKRDPFDEYDQYAFCISGEDEREFSKKFNTEQEALDALLDRLGIGWN